MCDPVTISAAVGFFSANAASIAAVSGVAATGLSVAGGIQQGKSQQAMARYQGQVADINAISADRAARDALERGELDAVKHGREVAQLRARQQHAYASSGVELGFGSPLDVVGDTNVLANQDNARIYENAGREADSYRINAGNYRANAAGARAEAANAGTSMIINAGSTLLAGASQVAGGWARNSRSYKAPAPRIFG